MIAPDLIGDLSPEIGYLLGDTHYNADNVRQTFEDETHFLVASKPGPYPRDDEGKDVRRIFHLLLDPLRTSTGSLRASLMSTRRCPQKGGSTRHDLHWGPSSSIN